MATSIFDYLQAIPDKRVAIALRNVFNRLLYPAEVLTGATTLTEAQTGRVFYLNSATEFATSLPVPKLGLVYEFIVGAAPSGASYTVVTAGSANIIKGQVLTSGVTATASADFETSGGDTISFVDGKAVASDWVVVKSDGTSWHMRGGASVYDAITITTAST